MASCARCKRPITGADARKAVLSKNEKGQVIGQMHYKCSKIDEKHGTGETRVRFSDDMPTAYEVAEAHVTKTDLSPEEVEKRRRSEEEHAALVARQREIAEQRALEPSPEAFSDWRDPIEADVDELTALDKKTSEELSLDELTP